MSSVLEKGLTGLSASELDALMRAIESDDLECPTATSDLSAAHLGNLRGRLGFLEGLGRDASLAAIRAAKAERAAIPSAPEIVWTGPEGAGKGRDTAVLLRELLERARKEVLVCGYSLDHGARLLRALHEAMTERGVIANFIVDVPRREGPSLENHLALFRQKFFCENWPFGPPFPRLLYDPRTVEPDSVVSVHAKVAVVDQEWTLITSANFTDRGQTRNLECGVCLQYHTVARSIIEHFARLEIHGNLRAI